MISKIVMLSFVIFILAGCLESREQKQERLLKELIELGREHKRMGC